MGSRQIACSLFLGAGIAIVALLIIPAVHVPFIVVHGPVSTLSSQRSAWSLIFLLWAAARVMAGLAFLPAAIRFAHHAHDGEGVVFHPLRLNCPLRC
jgi:hypothetical protein